MIKVDLIAAARPNFMKVAPVFRAAQQRHDRVTARIVHTGQHYDANMSAWFFRDLGIPDPHVNLEVGSGSHAEQTGGVMIAYERLCRTARPDVCIVVGDVNSTIACTLAATKLGIPVAHLEAGLRSRDRSMPEELNRIATDALSDLLWTPSADADENLRFEGIPAERIDRVGNVMIDSLELMRPKIEARQFAAEIGAAPCDYGVVTLHRPSNVDDPDVLRALMESVLDLSAEVPLVFPVHPRTRQRIAALGLGDSIAKSKNLRLLDPLGYIDFMSAVMTARFVLTDSGGVQEETTYLGIPCFTLRENTERPITVSHGTNRLIKREQIRSALVHQAAQQRVKRPVLEMWDGRAAFRVLDSLERFWRGR